MNFKEVVQGWLKAEGILQGQLARRLGMKPQSLSTMLARGNPTLATLHRFRRAMDVSMTVFEDECPGRVEDSSMAAGHHCEWAYCQCHSLEREKD